jgi:mercuric ion binding protein
MKKLALSALLAVFAALSAQAAPRQAKIEVSGMTCPSCPYIAAQAVEAIESVEITNGIYDEAAKLVIFELTYDDAVTTLAEIVAAPGEYGYPGRVLEGAPES